MAIEHQFGSRRIYYNNFAEHLQNAYNPNTLYPGLPNRWSDDEWCRHEQGPSEYRAPPSHLYLRRSLASRTVAV